MPTRTSVALAGIAGVEGVVLLGYAGYDVVQAARVGASGPGEVSNWPAIVLLVVITAGFGVGLLVVARGWWTGCRWARGPFIFAQLLAGLLGFQLAQSEESPARIAGIGLALLALLGLVLAFTPAVARPDD